MAVVAAIEEQEQKREKRQIVFGGSSFGSPSPVSHTRGTLYAVSHGSYNLGAAPSYSPSYTANANPYVEYAWKGFGSPLRVSYQPTAYAQPALSYPQPESRPAPSYEGRPAPSYESRPAPSYEARPAPVSYEYGLKVAHQRPASMYAPAAPAPDSYGAPCK